MVEKRKVTNLETDVLPLFAKLGVVDWIQVLHATTRIWSLGRDEGILRSAVDHLGRRMGDPRIVEGFLGETGVKVVRVGGEGRTLAVLLATAMHRWRNSTTRRV